MTNNRPQGQFTHFAKISNGHNSATCQPIPIMFGSMWGFRGRRIKWRHFWLDQIQDGSRRPLWKTSNGHISVMHCPIDFVFGSRVGFSPRTDRTALLQVCSPFWKFQRTISLKCIIRFTDHTLHSGSMTVDAYDRRLDTYFVRDGMKRTNEMADLEKITRKEYTLDWSQSKAFLVWSCCCCGCHCHWFVAAIFCGRRCYGHDCTHVAVTVCGRHCWTLYQHYHSVKG